MLLAVTYLRAWPSRTRFRERTHNSQLVLTFLAGSVSSIAAP